MRILSTFLFLFLSTIYIHAQQSMNMNLLYQYDVDTLPSTGGVQYNDVWGYVDCEGGEYAILGSASRVHFFDVSDPVNSFEVASFAGGGLSIWRDMKTYHNRAYAVSEDSSEGLMIFDLSDLPNSVTKTYHSTEFFGRSHNIFVDEVNGRLYVVGTDALPGGVIILDLTADPDQPVLLGNTNLPADPVSGTGYAHDIYVKNNIAYASHGYAGLFIWDLNDPVNPILLASKETGGYNHSSWISDDGSFAIFAEEVPTGRPLGVMNLENMMDGDIEIDHTFKIPLLSNDDDNVPHNPFIRGDYLICSYYEDGLQIFDISDPLNPTTAAYYDTYPDNTEYNGYAGNWGAYPFLPSGIILASDIVSGLFVLELDESIDLVDMENAPPVSVEIESQGSTEFCMGNFVNLVSVTDGTNLNYSWTLGGNELSTEQELEVTDAGIYTLTISTSHGCEYSSEVEITVNEPTIPTVEVNNNSLTASDATYYQWYFNGVIITGANQQTLEFTENGEYYVAIIDENGCSAISATMPVEFVTATQELASVQSFSIFPNPVNDWLLAQLKMEKATNFDLAILNANGQIVLEKTMLLQKEDNIKINVSTFPKGIYFLKIQSEEGSIVRKFVK